jgi:hypothetical protein
VQLGRDGIGIGRRVNALQPVGLRIESGTNVPHGRQILNRDRTVAELDQDGDLLQAGGKCGAGLARRHVHLKW